jgi:hypothetical protein
MTQIVKLSDRFENFTLISCFKNIYYAEQLPQTSAWRDIGIAQLKEKPWAPWPPRVNDRPKKTETALVSKIAREDITITQVGLSI